MIDDEKAENIDYSSQCAACANLSSMSRQTCLAYPRGIPQALYHNQVKHDRHYRGDQGIQFEREATA